MCTGRPKASLFPEVLELDFPALICGAGTYVEYEGRVLRNLLLPNQLLMQAGAAAGKGWLLRGAGRAGVLELPAEGRGFSRFRILDRLRREYPERLKQMELADGQDLQADRVDSGRAGL